MVRSSFLGFTGQMRGWKLRKIYNFHLSSQTHQIFPDDAHQSGLSDNSNCDTSQGDKWRPPWHDMTLTWWRWTRGWGPVWGRAAGVWVTRVPGHWGPPPGAHSPGSPPGHHRCRWPGGPGGDRGRRRGTTWGTLATTWGTPWRKHQVRQTGYCWAKYCQEGCLLLVVGSIQKQLNLSRFVQTWKNTTSRIFATILGQMVVLFGWILANISVSSPSFPRLWNVEE